MYGGMKLGEHWEMYSSVAACVVSLQAIMGQQNNAQWGARPDFLGVYVETRQCGTAAA